MTRTHLAYRLPAVWITEGRQVTVDGHTGRLDATWGERGRMVLMLDVDGVRTRVEVARDAEVVGG